jgi:hypothetical protein
MRQIDIANKYNITKTQIHRIKKGLRYTASKDVALDLSQITNKAPIEYINPGKRELYLKAYPELSSAPAKKTKNKKTEEFLNE